MIRKATTQDYEQIKHIKEAVGLKRENLSDRSYKEKIAEEGFLLYGDLPFEKYKTYLLDVTLVYEENGKILGFIQLGKDQEVKKESPTTWFDSTMQEIYFSQPHAGLHRIAIDPQVKGKGIATQLLNAVIQYMPKDAKYLFSLVVNSPIANKASMNWHQKNGFKKVAEIHYEHKNELDNFGSTLFAKKV